MPDILASLAFPAFLGMPVGPTELIIILAIVLVIFGPKKLPELGRAIGQSIKEFKKPAEEDEAAEKKE